MDRSLENLLLANIKASFYLKNNKILAYLDIFFVPLSLKTTQNNRSSPHTNNEIVQNSKLKPRKFSFLCTFKEGIVLPLNWGGAKLYHSIQCNKLEARQVFKIMTQSHERNKKNHLEKLKDF